MQLETLTYNLNQGWSAPLPVKLDSPQTLVLAFGAHRFIEHPKVFAALIAAFPQAVIAGCSSSGEIAGACVYDDSISVAIARFESTQLRLAITEVANAEASGAAGKRLALQLAEPCGVPHIASLRAVLVLSNGIDVNGTQLVHGMTQGLPAGVPITGGMAGDGGLFVETWVLDRARPGKKLVCAIGFYGERLHIGHGCNGGWSDFGPERRVTRSTGNVLYELDGQPALDLYKSYLGERAAGLPGTGLLFPLSIRAQKNDLRALVRTIIGIDEEQRSITFAGDIPQGAIARLMRTGNEALIASAGKAMDQALANLQETTSIASGAPLLALSISCVGRRLLLGERIEEEVEVMLESAPSGSGHVGFYSHGEISPFVGGGVSALHNQTMTVTLFSES